MNDIIIDPDLRRPVRGIASVIARVQSERRAGLGRTEVRTLRPACHWSRAPLSGRPVCRWTALAAA
ncbi:MAG: hypothetical protein ACK4QW_15645 [Alphaproteobacteria bacterium]